MARNPRNKRIKKMRRTRAKFAPTGDFCSYAKARVIVETLAIRSSGAYRRWCDKNPRECKRLRLPRKPSRCYLNWAGWRAFLGTSGTSGARRKTYMRFDEARAKVRKWAKKHHLHTQKDWFNWAKAKKNRRLLAKRGKRREIPVRPNVVLQYRKTFKTSQRRFISYADWLGTNTKASAPHYHE